MITGKKTKFSKARIAAILVLMISVLTYANVWNTNQKILYSGNIREFAAIAFSAAKSRTINSI